MWNNLSAIANEWLSRLDALTNSRTAVSLFTILAIAGLILLLLARRRRGAAPHCRRCGYDLTGRVSDRCSECGADLIRRRAIRTGRRRLSPAWAAAGLLMLITGAVPAGRAGWVAARSYDWYQLKPIVWVLDDLRRPNTRSGHRAVDRIARMAFAGELSDNIASRAVDASLDGLQSAGYHGNDWSSFELLGLLYSTRDFSPEQTARLLETFCSRAIFEPTRHALAVQAGRHVGRDMGGREIGGKQGWGGFQPARHTWAPPRRMMRIGGASIRHGFSALARRSVA